MNEQEHQEFTLEDIIKEFGDHPDPEEQVSEPAQDTTAEAQDNEPVQDTEPDAQIVSEPETTSEPAPAAADEPTIRFAPVEDAVPVQDSEPTIRFTPVEDAAPASAVTSDTIRMDAIRLPKVEAPNAVVIDDEDSSEPYSGQWEPDYEDPIGDYTPPPPIIAHPRSRLRELKRKLVAGPEKRYYALLEKGLGKLQAAIFLSFLVMLISAGATVLYTMGMVQENRLKLMVFSQFFAMLVSALLGSFQLIDGGVDILKKRFSMNSLLLITFLVCCIDGILALDQLRVPCCAAFSLANTMSLWSAYQRRNAEMGEMDTMRKANHLDGMAIGPDGISLLHREGQVEDFMDHCYDSVKPEKVLNIFALCASFASVAIGITAGILQKDLFAGIQVTAVSLLAAVPASAFIAVSRPKALLVRRLHKAGSVICGWNAVEQLSKQIQFPLTQDDLFPAGTIRMNGVKFYGSRSPEEIISYATAVLTTAGDGLAPLFTQVLESRNGRHLDASELQSYEIGGVGGTVNEEAVIVGTLECMRELEVSLPDGIRVEQAVCVAIAGDLCGVFALTYDKMPRSVAAMTTLTSYRRLRGVISGADFMLTESFIHEIFGIKPNKLSFANSEEWAAIVDQQPEEDAQTLILRTADGVLPMAYAVTGAKSLRSASRTGVFVHMLGGILGLGTMLLLTILGALELLTPANMFLYQLVWAIPGLLITEWTRSI